MTFQAGFSQFLFKAVTYSGFTTVFNYVLIHIGNIKLSHIQGFDLSLGLHYSDGMSFFLKKIMIIPEIICYKNIRTIMF